MIDAYNKKSNKAHYHLPGLFEFYDFYSEFLPLYFENPEYFYDWCDIGSIYGAPADCLWGGGRVGFGEQDPSDVLDLMNKYQISARLTLSNSLLTNEHLTDKRCNSLCAAFNNPDGRNGAIVYSDILVEYLKANYPYLYLVSSTTKVLTDFEDFKDELNREDFKFVVPDFRLNKRMDELLALPPNLKSKVEFLCNECCDFNCISRKACYQEVSRKSLGEDSTNLAGHRCTSLNGSSGYKFSDAMKNPSFIGVDDIKDTYLPNGFTEFKIEGRGLGSAILLEFILHYMTKPSYQLIVREEMYLDSMLDLF